MVGENQLSSDLCTQAVVHVQPSHRLIYPQISDKYLWKFKNILESFIIPLLKENIC